MTLVSVSILISMLLTLILGVPYIAFLKKHLYGQYIREEVPDSHAKKAGTPTMGGVIIAIPVVIASILALVMMQYVTNDALIILFTFILFTFVGFRDDITKILKKNNKGLSAKRKLLLQFAIAMIPAIYMTISGETYISFFDIHSINLGIFYPIFVALVIVGASNAVNLTDGLDGLATGTSAIAFLAMTVIFLTMGRYDIAAVSGAVFASCIGFLYYNKYPAQVFMGDTGSLALGGILGTIAIIGKIEIMLLPISIIFIIETLSVIIQVISFKTTGKRVFKMSPIHHHFELCGWNEKKIVNIFCIIGFIFALISCLVFFSFETEALKLWG
ncbi:MAG: phospho-N-acetylmuramoyl-pentapeptide-transferase [Candidatus Gastranaerophilales bacterium]|nr:phospho-N-acetylmuramoyl-pentapeptide-transferase [Candidatus Gastranaerophilales bacterium]